MARDSDRMDLHADDVLFGQENDVFGFESSLMSNVNPAVSFSETLIGGVGGINSSMGMFSGSDMVGFHMNSGCNVSEKEGFYQENFNGLGDGGMLGVVDGGCDGKVGKFSHGLVQNEDETILSQSTGGGCAEFRKDLVFGLNNGVQIEHAAKVSEVSLDMEDLFSRKSFLSDAQEDDNVIKDSVFSDVNYRISDLVWGKVRGHPWWPGQIYDPAIASETAKSYWEEDCYLIAYFGGQKFAWNEVSTIKPFYKQFSEMAKQTDCESFRFAVDCALEEASRRVALGLSCPCLPEEVSSNLKTEVVANADICNQSFEPAELVSFVQSLAQSPLTEFDRLDLARARGQVSAFYRSKGYSQLPEFAVHDRLFVPDMETLPVREEERCNGQVLKTGQCFLPDLMSEKNSRTPYGELTLEKKAGGNFTSRRGRKRKTSQEPSYDCFQDDKSTSRRGRKRKTLQDPSYDCFQDFQIEDDKSTSRCGRKPKAAYNTSDDCFQNFQITVNNLTPRKRGRKPKATYNTSDDCFQNFQTAVNNSTPRKRGRKPKLACNTYDNCFNNSQTGNSTEFENVSVHDMWSHLCLAAKDPAGESCYTDMIHYFADFRKVTGRNNSVFLEQGFSLEQKCDGETGAIASIEAAVVASVSAPMDVGSIEAAAVTSVSAPMVLSSIEAVAVASVSTPVELGSIEAAAVASVSTAAVASVSTAAVASVSTAAVASVSTAAVASVSTTPMQLCSDSSLEEETFLNKQEREEVSPTTGLHDGSLISEHFTHVEQQNLRSEPMEHTSISEEGTQTQPETLLNKQNLPPEENTYGNLASELSNLVEHASKSSSTNLASDLSNPVEHGNESSPTEPSNPVEHANESSLTEPSNPVEHANESSPTEPSNPVEHANESSPTEPSNLVEHANESSPTAFILKFTNFDWGLSATDLNQIFARFGPLIESKTELLERNKCVRVVFKRRIDAESAFCSAGNYNIFGASLKSYRLKILPPPMPKKATGKKRGRKSKKEIASIEAAAV
ncbi:unnamed protein product [Vicia faba]|uniref:PWWP domain-containing protein n=1 Tax=Vicia faba TaxID=3906 RepID=A0AAV1A0L5_VICFA|nr:unnamed protein product [Vicia faba]